MSGIALLGSCVTRDALVTDEDAIHPITVVSRTGFASLMRPPVAGFVPPDVFGTLKPGGFPERVLRMDIEKTGLDAIERLRPDVLFIDFMDDRLALRCVGGSVVYESDEFRDAGLATLEPFASGRTISRLADEAWILWRDGLARFRERVDGGPLRECRIVLHRAYYANRWRHDTLRQEMLPRGGSNLPYRVVALTMNTLFRRMHDAFEAAFPDADVIEVDSGLRMSDPQHVWGPAAFHYIPEYYAAFRDAAAAAGIPIGSGAR